MSQECINLQERFGDRFRITWDPAYDPKGIHAKDPWYMQIPGAKRGVTLYPHGGDTLAVEVNYHPGVCRQLDALGLKLHQDGGRHGERTYLFNVSRFEEVAAIVQPRKRRRLNPEQRAECTARLARVRPQPLRSGEMEGVKPPPAASDGPDPSEGGPDA
jgi:hypothetical protein